MVVAETPLGTDDDALRPEPAHLTGALVGYARVSTRGQNLDRQLHALHKAGCLRVYADKQTGKNVDRSELTACLDYLRPGDTLIVPSLDRLARSLQDLITIVGDLRRAGVGFRSLHEALDTTTPGGRLVFHVFAALAEFIRELIVEGTHEGLAAARARGTRLGRPPALNAEQVRQARALLAQPDNSVASIARLLGVSRSTLYNHVPELTASTRQATAVTMPATVVEPPTGADAHSTTTTPAAGRRGLDCPNCGHRPVNREEAEQQRGDVAMVWFHLNEHGRLESTHHCAQCAPPGPVTDLPCSDCADGPLWEGRHDAIPQWSRTGSAMPAGRSTLVWCAQPVVLAELTTEAAAWSVVDTRPGGCTAPCPP